MGRCGADRDGPSGCCRPPAAAIPAPIRAPIPARSSGCSGAGAEPLLALLLPALLEHRPMAARSSGGPRERGKKRAGPLCNAGVGSSRPRTRGSASLSAERIQRFCRDTQERAAGEQRGEEGIFPLLAKNAFLQQG